MNELTQEEIKEKLIELTDKITETENEFFAVRSKYEDIAEKEYPMEKYHTLLRQYQEEKYRYEQMLKAQISRSDYATFVRELFKRFLEKYHKINKNPKKFPTEFELASQGEKYDKFSEELNERLVKTVIEFLLEKGDANIDEVNFKVDGIQESVIYGEWNPGTDSAIAIYGLANTDDTDFPIRKKLGSSY